jgi:hypothetical protein
MILSATLVSLLGAAAPDDNGKNVDDSGWIRLAVVPTEHEERELCKAEFSVDTPQKIYAKVRIRVHGPAVHFTKVAILFDNGDVREIQMDKTVENDEGTGPLDLPGKARKIKQVAAMYRVVGHHRAAGTLTLWGLQ